MKKRVKLKDNDPSGLVESDTLEDALFRADTLSSPHGGIHSVAMTNNKDLRRIVLLAREYRKLKNGYNPKIQPTK